ncbi:hypothetical protein J437_LFUL006483 [Ladona fulva]|uniref:G-protein coupled receptors family 1 profile domain-containing protein n=1 Tax=Ladona fulva TaxID=123851 RepID=A0A8K0K3W4_LADFU|nr:hypothetical protein J437_LFUL006483 [Ladona fulva]
MASHNRTDFLVHHYSSSPSPLPWSVADLASNSSWFDDASAEWQAYTTTVSSLDELNSTVNATDEHGGARHDDIITNKGVQAVFCILYTLIFILGMFGNALVCYVVGRNRSMQTVTNLFITNLALSDVLLCMLAVPFTPLYSFLRRWIFGKALCHLMPYAQMCIFVGYVSIHSLCYKHHYDSASESHQYTPSDLMRLPRAPNINPFSAMP